MDKKKKVFRIWKWMQSLGYDESAIKVMEQSLKVGWPQKCEGKTKKQCLADGSATIILDYWLVEE